VDSARRDLSIEGSFDPIGEIGINPIVNYGEFSGIYFSRTKQVETPGEDSLKPNSSSSSHLDPGSNPGISVDSDGVYVLKLALKNLIIEDDI